MWQLCSGVIDTEQQAGNGLLAMQLELKYIIGVGSDSISTVTNYVAVRIATISITAHLVIVPLLASVDD